MQCVLSLRALSERIWSKSLLIRCDIFTDFTDTDIYLHMYRIVYRIHISTTQIFLSYTFPDVDSVCLPEFSFTFEIAIDSFVVDFDGIVCVAPA